MAFKKHAPKRFTAKLRRKFCPVCDLGSPLFDFEPPVCAHVEGHQVPMNVDVSVRHGMMSLVIIAPHREYHVLEVPHGRRFDWSLAEDACPDYQVTRKTIAPKILGFNVPVRYCPVCGRDMKTGRPRIWR